MALDTSSGVPVLVFVLLFRASSAFTLKNQTVCHSASDCGRARLTCDAGQRLAILGIYLAYTPLNNTSVDHCLSSVHDCSAIPPDCCQPPEDSEIVVCEEVYPQGFLEAAYANCSAQLSAGSSGADGGGGMCSVELPAVPQVSTGRCKSPSPYHSLSSYSVVRYACAEESGVAQFCQASERRGNLLYTLWAPTTDPALRLGRLNATSCRCRVTAASGVHTQVIVRALDVRIPKSHDQEACSYVTVADSDRTRLSTRCSQKTAIFFDGTSRFLTQARPPVDVILHLHPNSAPAVVWIGFQGNNANNLTVSCFDAGKNIAQETPKPEDNSFSAPIAAAIGGVFAAVIFVIIVVFICFHFFSKRKRSYKRRKTPSWWERIRHEDHLAGLSQNGPSCGVNPINGRYHRRRSSSYPPLPPDINPTVYFTPEGGSAAPPRRTSRSTSVPSDQADSAPPRRRTSSSGEHHPGARTVDGVVSNKELFQIGEPSVRYVPMAGRDGEDPQSLVIVNDGSKVRCYEIPPLTIKEVEEEDEGGEPEAEKAD